MGFDNDTPTIFRRQAEFIQQNGIVTAMVGLLQAPTGTPLYERLKREGRLLGKMSGNNDGSTNIIPRMDPNVLREGYNSLLEAIYSPKNYYKRIRTFLREYRKPKFDIPLDMHRLLALFRANIRLGVIGKERLQYWKIIFWALIRRPRVLPEAITFAIYGYHFRKVAGI